MNVPISQRICAADGCKKRALYSMSKFTKPGFCGQHKMPDDKLFNIRICDLCKRVYHLNDDTTLYYISNFNGRYRLLLCPTHGNFSDVRPVHVDQFEERDPSYMIISEESIRLANEIVEYAKKDGFIF